MKFRSDLVTGLFNNESDVLGVAMRSVDPHGRIVVAQGFGSKGTGIPLRFLAYIVPVLHLARQLPESARLEFYFALHGVMRANGSTGVFEDVSVMQSVLFKYLALAHPNLKQETAVLTDSPLEGRKVANAVIDRLVDVAANLEVVKEGALASFIGNRGGTRALRYMVEHCLYMRDPLDLGDETSELLLVDGMATSMDHLIMIGGPAEKIFYRLRKALEVIGKHDRWKSHQFFTPIGDPPSYHLQEGEATWEDRQELPGDVVQMLRATSASVSRETRRNVIRDLLVLLIDAAGESNFRLADEVGRISRGLGPSEARRPALQRGWDRIKEI